MAIKGYELIQAMEDYAPTSLAVANDRIGLQVGERNAPVNKVLVTLEVTESVVDEAIQNGANWIVAHHAAIFQPLKELRTDTPKGRILKKCLYNGLNIFVAHTNLDVTPNGVNDVLAKRLELSSIEPLLPDQFEKLKKLVVFIPESHVDQVREAIGKEGAGWIGNYSDCTFQVSGTGTFMPREEANPYIGSRGKLEKVAEVRLETIITEKVQNRVIQAMLDAHPYEEVAYDLYPLEQQGTVYGLGRIGQLPAPIKFAELIERVKQAYQLDHLRFVGDPNALVQRIAVLGGSGARYWQQAQQRRADVYLTGDIDYHTAQDALAADFRLIDPGHHVEQLVIDTVCQELSKRFENKIEVIPSTVDFNPFRFA